MPPCPILFYERSLVRLSDEEQELCERAFSCLDKVAVKRILRRGQWVDVEPGEVLVREGRSARSPFSPAVPRLQR